MKILINEIKIKFFKLLFANIFRLSFFISFKIRPPRIFRSDGKKKNYT